MIATDNLRKDADQFRSMQTEDALYELLGDHLENSDWEFVQPEDIDALTSGPILADWIERDNRGDVTKVGNMYWNSRYQVESSVEELLTTGRVTWEQAN